MTEDVADRHVVAETELDWIFTRAQRLEQVSIGELLNIAHYVWELVSISYLARLSQTLSSSSPISFITIISSPEI